MGVSIHNPEYREMWVEINQKIRNYVNIPHMPDDFYDGLTNDLFSIMNDYGAVSWT